MTVVEDPKGSPIYLVGSVRDITDRKHMEQALRESEERLRLIAETIQDVFWMSTPGVGKMLYVSPAYEKIWGRTRNSLYEQPQSFMDAVHSDDKELVLAQLAGHASGSWECQYRILQPDGRVRWIHDRGFPIRDENGTLRLMTGVATDITDRREAEEALRQLMNKLEESNQALQDFASIASHDLKEPLRKVSSFGKMLQERLGNSMDDRARDYLNRMLSATGRMQALINSLLDYSRVTLRAEPFTKVDLYVLIEEVLSDLEVRIARSGGKVCLGELPSLEADPTQMRQLFQNLIGNGLKFHKQGETPLVCVRSCQLNDLEVGISIEDNGIGFDESEVDHIFAPFRRLHGRSSQYEGTGMGLAICKKIVERHGGSITCTSTPGEGSTFYVHLPLRQGECNALD